jgi:2,5-diketo-D-gluconate reductase A
MTATNTVKLDEGGVEMPSIGFGTWRIPTGDPTRRAVGTALEAGYRHIDTAQGYGNEADVGRALAESGISRDDVFITTKFDPGARDAEREAERSLERLGIESLDLYLVHWPLGGPAKAWPGMERALTRGLTRAIGVSNFDAGELETLCEAALEPPSVNQIQLNPFRYRRALIATCRRLGVAVEAYSPLNHGEDLDHPALLEVAGRHQRTPAQVLLRWGIQRGFPVIPKSTKSERILENARIFDFALDDRGMAALDALDRTGGTARALEDKWWTLRARIAGRLAGITGRAS